MRKFYVVWDAWYNPYGDDGPIKQEVVLKPGEKANPETFAEKIRGLSPFGIAKCNASDIIGWSLIED